MSWAATRPTAVITRPNATNEAASAADPAAGSPVPIIPAPTPSPTSTFATATTTSAAAGPACRPSTADRISSVRPASSSARVCRTTSSTLIRPTAT